MTDQEKISLTEAWVGSKEWVIAIQDNILDNRSICFACGDQITFKADFFYMRGARGLVMLHDTCFTPWPAKKPKLRSVVPNGNGALPPGEWLTIFEAGQVTGVRYMTIYQRIAAGSLAAEKRDGKWMVSRTALAAWDAKLVRPGRKPVKKATKSRIWRSEVTESTDRISLAEAGRKIGASRSWVLERRDKFDAVKIAGEWRLSTKLVEDYIAEEE